jgi:hypothetical protein
MGWLGWGNNNKKTYNEVVKKEKRIHALFFES